MPLGQTPRKRGRAFYRIKFRQLAREPLCRTCFEAGRITAAQVADHILPLSVGGAENDPSNLQSLCRECHGAKTRKESWIRAPVSTDTDGWPI